MDYVALKAELAKPAYTGLTDAAAAAAINAAVVAPSRAVIPAYEVVNATVAAEWAALTAAEKQRYQTIVGAGQVDARNVNVRAAFAAMFGAGTQTRTNLLALQDGTPAPFWRQIGRTVDAGDVAAARAS